MTRVFKWSESISVITWETEIVIFHNQSGDTYLFDGNLKKIISWSLSKTIFNFADLVLLVNSLFSNTSEPESVAINLVNDLRQKALIFDQAM